MNYVQSFNIQARRQGKSLAQEWALRFKIIQIIKYDVPEKPFVLWRLGEEITWLPTGEVTSKPLKLSGTKVRIYQQNDFV